MAAPMTAPMAAPPAKLNAANLARVSRSLTNPDIKVELRADFPAPASFNDMTEFRYMLESELKKQGLSIDTVERISVAYPHKNPEAFPDHFNSADAVIKEFIDAVKSIGVEWIKADGIVENVRLGRSEDQSALHALMGKQVYSFHAPSQKTPLPFADAQSPGQKELFIIVDTCIEQGTTLTNLRSFIEHNGGHVLFASTRYGKSTPLQQAAAFSVASISGAFADASRNTKGLRLLAASLQESAKKEGIEISAQDALQTFEDNLNIAGNTVFAMTHLECERLTAGIQGGATPYTELMKKLRGEATAIMTETEFDRYFEKQLQAQAAKEGMVMSVTDAVQMYDSARDRNEYNYKVYSTYDKKKLLQRFEQGTVTLTMLKNGDVSANQFYELLESGKMTPETPRVETTIALDRGVTVKIPPRSDVGFLSGSVEEKMKRAEPTSIGQAVRRVLSGFKLTR